MYFLVFSATVPSAIPLESIQGSAYEEKIILKWREPAQTYGIITQYEVRHSYIHQPLEKYTDEYCIVLKSTELKKKKCSDWFLFSWHFDFGGISCICSFVGTTQQKRYFIKWDSYSN